AGESLDVVGRVDLADLRVGATLVAGAWPELGVAGLLWDGDRLVGVAPASDERLAAAMGDRPVPVALELEGLRQAGVASRTRLPLVTIGPEPDQTVVGRGPLAAPRSTLPQPGSPPSWVTVVGRPTMIGGNRSLVVDGVAVRLSVLCTDRDPAVTRGALAATGVALGEPVTLVVGCDGLRSAPSLALALASGDSASGDGRRPLSAAVDVPRSSAASALAVAVLALSLACVAGAIVARRFGRMPRSEFVEVDVVDDP
ncbi:MAG: hypothetical protein ABIW50_05875, partial [Candidatus Limnocylindria bacterium]